MHIWYACGPSAKQFWDGLERFGEELEELGAGNDDVLLLTSGITLSYNHDYDIQDHTH